MFHEDPGTREGVLRAGVWVLLVWALKGLVNVASTTSILMLDDDLSIGKSKIVQFSNIQSFITFSYSLQFAFVFYKSVVYGLQ
jgi:hypothetical protein